MWTVKAIDGNFSPGNEEKMIINWHFCITSTEQRDRRPIRLRLTPIHRSQKDEISHMIGCWKFICYVDDERIQNTNHGTWFSLDSSIGIVPVISSAFVTSEPRRNDTKYEERRYKSPFV